MRPTVRPPPGVQPLRDPEVASFLEANRVALLAFLASGDAASESVRARLALVVAKLGIAAGMVDVDRDRLVAEALGVRSAPMLFVFREGEVVDRLIGAPPEAIIEDVVRARL